MKQFATPSGLVAATLLLSAVVQPVVAHSWVEQLMLIAANGTMTGAAGYMRGYVSRASAGFYDDMDNYLLPPNGRTVGATTILATDSLCHPSQRSSNYSTEFPMLSVSAGDYIALRYQENGHVTLPDVNPTKPLNRGTVYVYGTTEPASDELFADVFQKWTADGTGGNGRGRLLATRNFDDGQCYQVNGGSISTTRQAGFKKVAENPQGSDLWCQNDIQLPKDLASDSKYTLYWIWSWPTFDKAGSPTDIASPGFKVTHLQYYTSCMDVAVASSSSSGSSKAKANTNNFAASFVHNQDLNSAAVLSQLEVGAFQVAVPGSTGGNSTTGSGSGSSGSSGSSASTGATASASTKASTKTAAATGSASSAKGDHTVFVTVTEKQSTATVTVTETTVPPSDRKTYTVTTQSTLYVTETVQPSPSGSSAANANGAAATTSTSISASVPAKSSSSSSSSSKTRSASTATTSTTAAVFVPTPGQTVPVQPFLTAATTAATTFKRVRRH